MMLRRNLLFIGLLLITCSCAYGYGSSSCWWLSLQAAGDTWVGVDPRYTDGYDGQLPFDVNTIPNTDLNLFFYRENGTGWSGPTGFYGTDYESPIPNGESKTWWDIYLWMKDTSSLPDENKASISILPDGPLPPSGYWAQLVLDYVPESLNWTGPMSYTMPLDRISMVLLPVPEVSDGLQGTRMHLTVYTYPVPEPSSVIALLSGLAGLGIVIRCRR